MARPLHILVTDDNRSSADALSRILAKRGDTVKALYSGADAIAYLDHHTPDLILTDLKMEPVDGMAVLAAARQHAPPIETIVFTAFGAVDVAVGAMQMGARDFLTKPVTVPQLTTRIEALRTELETVRPAPARISVPPSMVKTEPPTTFVAQSEAAKELLATLRLAAGVPTPVWVEGELGSGRRYVARKLHELGGGGPIRVVGSRPLKEWPQEGSVLLQNVDHLPIASQQELAQQLSSLPKSVRPIATTGSGAALRVAEGTLAPELFYALAVVTITVPPLRDRAEDIVPLFQAGLKQFANQYQRDVPRLKTSAFTQLLEHRWPGNVRELLNLAERVVVLGEPGFQLSVQSSSNTSLPNLEPGFSLAKHLEEVERKLLIEALHRSDGDRTEAGRLLGVERNTLRYKLNKYGLLEK